MCSISYSYAFKHVVVRNDYHCPTCRMYYLSFHSFAEGALSQFPDDEELRDPVLGNTYWIDEWVRRRNGDSYQAFKVYIDGSYDVTVLDDMSETYSKFYGVGNGNVQYMTVRTIVDKSKWCPTNIRFELKFFSSFEEAYKYMNDMMTDVFVEYTSADEKVDIVYNYENQQEENCDSIRVFKYKIDKSSAINGVVTEHEIRVETGIFEHCKIVKIEEGKQYCLNNFCDKISEENGVDFMFC